MDIVNRAKNICLTPNTEWPVIAAEPTPPATLITEYVVPLAAIGAVAGFIGGSIVGTGLGMFGSYRVPLVAGLIAAVFTFVMAIVGCFLISLIINALAPSFGGQKDSAQALKVAVYSYTPAWIAGVLNILPILGGLLGILAGLYGLYLLYLGLPKLMKNPEDKSLGYTVVVVVCAIVIMVVVGSVGSMITAGAMMGTGMFPGMSSRASSSDVQFDKNTPLGKLQDLGTKLEESNKKMEAAQKSGDANAQAAAAIESLGTLLGGGKRVDPVSPDQLKPLVPDHFAGLPKTKSSSEKEGALGLMMSKAEATYGDGAEKRATLEITDTGGVSGLTAMAGWAGVEGDSDDENGSEKTYKKDGRLVHEKLSKSGGTNEFAIVIADRFVVGAKGNGVTLDELKSAVSGIDLAKLEGMKGVGVK